MTGKTHIVGGIVLASSFSILSGIYAPTDTLSSITWLSYLVGTSSGAIIMDIDKKRSKIGCKHKVISFFTEALLGHRGFTHSLLALGTLGIISLAIYILLPYTIIGALLIGYIIGAGSHILLDMLNPEGVPLLYPIKKKFHILTIKAGSFLEKILFVGICIACIFVLAKQAEGVPILRQFLNLI